MPAALSRCLDFDRAGPRHGVAIGLAAAALLLRLWHLDTQPLWFDEAMTAHIVYSPDGLAYVHNTPPLYYWLLRGWTGWFGIGPAGMRSFSALAGALFVWSSFHAARCAFGNRAALPAALFALAAPIHLYYSQEARAYALLMFELMVVLWMLWRLAKDVRFGAWLALVIASAAAMYTHYLAGIALALAHVATGVLAPAPVRRRLAIALLAAGVTVLLLLLPWVAWWWQRTPFESRDMSWLTLLWQQLPGASALMSSVELLLVGGQEDPTQIFLKQFTSLRFPGAARNAALVSAGVLVGLCLLRLRQANAWQRLTTMHCAVMFVGPLAVSWLVSFVQPIYCPGRYDLIAFPGLVLLLGGAIGDTLAAGRAVTRWSAAAAVVVLAAVLVAKDWCYFAAAPAANPSPAVARLLEANVQPHETVVLCGTVGVPVLAQLYQDGYVWSDHTCRSARTNVEFGCRLLPPALEEAPGSVTRYLRALEDGSLAADLGRVLSAAQAPGIWLVLGEDLRTAPRNHPLFQVLHDAGYELAHSEPALGVAHLRRRSAK